tara:strand:+ start:9 stop:1313 length:1305 start_codon:yes stop_codon:yes gene_type:complete
MSNFININESKISVIGLGYVGLPLAIEFSNKFEVVGFDIDKQRVQELKNGYDRTNEISEGRLNKLPRLELSSSISSIRESNIYIITVPTPVDKRNKPNLNPLISATKTVASVISKNDVVIYESTVFPGCTEQVCIPVIEQISKLKYNSDFFCGYSPERINPGDKKHVLTNIQKITSGSNPWASEFVDLLYKEIILAGTFKAKSIAVAEAAKVIENTQRDVNIALVNELAIIFNKLNLDTKEVLKAAGTKWNFLPFKPGLVGGHCIGVDPYYLTHRASEVGYHPEIILAGRRINDNMGFFIAENTVGELVRQGVNPSEANIGVLGLTFKENCPDLRNTKVTTIIEKLKEYRCNIVVSDCYINKDEAKSNFDFNIEDLINIKSQDALIIAVGHRQYLDFSKNDWIRMVKKGGVVVDVKSIYNREIFKLLGINYWSL